jgi:hypothetical protein
MGAVFSRAADSTITQRKQEKVDEGYQTKNPHPKIDTKNIKNPLYQETNT